MNQLPPPVGAVWVRGLRLRDRIEQVFEKHEVKLTRADLDFIFCGGHTLAVKINDLKQKYIAIENGKKQKSTQPDYYIHVYQAHTGAAPQYPFGPDTSTRAESEVHITENGENNQSGAKDNERNQKSLQNLQAVSDDHRRVHSSDEARSETGAESENNEDIRTESSSSASISLGNQKDGEQ